MKVLDWNITDLEKDVLTHGYYDYVTREYGSVGACAWTNHIINYCEIVTSKQISGVMSSLTKKGLIISDVQDGQDATFLTQDGFRVLNELVDDERIGKYLKWMIENNVEA